MGFRPCRLFRHSSPPPGGSDLSKSLSRLAVGVTLLLQLFTFNGNAEAEIRLGILPRLGAVELFMMFKPLAEYLTEATGEKVSIVIPRDFDAFKEGVRSGNMDIGFANPLIYVQLRQEMALSPLVVAAEQKGGTRFRGVIIVRTDSGIKTIRDLRGKKCIFEDILARLDEADTPQALNLPGYRLHALKGDWKGFW